MADSLERILRSFKDRRIVVIGDAILDRYLIGQSERLSREAPVPVLELQERRQILGGAANPAANLANLGAAVHFVSAIGADEDGEAILSSLDELGIRRTACLALPTRQTTVKTRILARSGLRSPQQLARLDRSAGRQPLNAAEETRLCTAVAELPPVDALLCSDYGGGVLSAGVLAAIRAKAKQDPALLTSDAQSRLAAYQGFDLVKCNAAEAASELAREMNTDSDFGIAADELQNRLDCGALVITRGAAGATLAQRAAATQPIPAPQVNDVYDTVGAGDTAIAIMTLALASGATPETAVQLANVAGGIVVRHFGNYTPSPEEIAAALA